MGERKSMREGNCYRGQFLDFPYPSVIYILLLFMFKGLQAFIVRSTHSLNTFLEVIRHI